MQNEHATPPALGNCGIPTGCQALDELLGGGYPKGKITEMVESAPSRGAQSLIHQALENARQDLEYLALVDAYHQFDPESSSPQALESLLWIRCPRPEDASKACDILLRDDHFPLMILDLRNSGIHQLHRFTPQSWYRLQRVSEQSRTAFLIFTSQSLVPCAYHRFQCSTTLPISMLDSANTAPLQILEFDILKRRMTNEVSATELRTAQG